jgi:hypothetical protein
LLLALVPCVHAQNHSAKDFVKDLGQDQKRIWTSPLRMFHKENFVARTLPLLAGTAILIAVDRPVVEKLPNSRSQIRWGGNVSHAGAAYVLGAGTVGALAAGRLRKDGDLENMGWHGIEALVGAAAVTFALKFAFGRERPDLNPHGRFYQGRDGFPSGHAMASWAVASAVANSRSCPKWLKITSYTLASIVSASRVAANRHFPSDVFAGAMMGGMIGGYVAGH